MSNLSIENFSIDKSDWTPVKFGDVVFEPKESVKDPAAAGIEHVVGLEHIDSEDIHLRRWATIEESTTFTKKFSAGDLLFGRRRAYLKKAAQATIEGICSGDITVMQANDGLMPELLPFLVNNDKFFDHAITHSAGGLSPRVKFKDLAKYEFLLPPKAQQAELAELLWALDEMIQKQYQVANNVHIVLESSKKRSFDYGYGVNSKQLPKEWKMMKVRDLATVQAGSTPLRSNAQYFEDGTLNWLKTLDLNNGLIFHTEEKITEFAIQETSCKIKPVNTVLVAMYGGFNQIGRTGLLKIPSATNQAVSAIEVDEAIINPEYLLHVLNAKVDYWKRVAISSRKDPNITKIDVENFPVPIPSVEEQSKLVKSTNRLLHTEQSAVNAISESRNMQKSLINQIF